MQWVVYALAGSATAKVACGLAVMGLASIPVVYLMEAPDRQRAREQLQWLVLVDAGSRVVSLRDGASVFDSAASFAMIRGGHIDLAILGAMQVSQTGDLANWMIPGTIVKGPGGAMDLVTGAKQVLIVMDHVSKRGDKKILNDCSLPLTGQRVVNKLVTSLAVIEVTPDGLRLLERAPGVSVEDIRSATEPELLIDGDVPEVII